MPLKLVKELKQGFMLHPIAAHFSNGVVPVAVLYLLLFLPTGDPFFERTAIHLLVVVLLGDVAMDGGRHELIQGERLSACFGEIQ